MAKKRSTQMRVTPKFKKKVKVFAAENEITSIEASGILADQFNDFFEMKKKEGKVMKKKGEELGFF